MLTKFQKGDIVRHYKNGLAYRIVGEGLDTFCGNEVVIYEPLYPCDQPMFTRPVREFEGMVDDSTPRFSKLPPEEVGQGYAVYLHPVVRMKIPVMANSKEEALKKAMDSVCSGQHRSIYDLLRVSEGECLACGVAYVEFAESFAFSMVESMPPSDGSFEDPENTWYFDQEGKDVTDTAIETQVITAKF